jgi:hypothetical protein
MHKGWCCDPDKAFDIGCRNLGCEDWCKDNSNCCIQGKDKTMFIMGKKEIDSKDIERADVVLYINKLGDTFTIIKHPDEPIANPVRQSDDLIQVLKNSS